MVRTCQKRWPAALSNKVKYIQLSHLVLRISINISLLFKFNSQSRRLCTLNLCLSISIAILQNHKKAETDEVSFLHQQLFVLLHGWHVQWRHGCWSWCCLSFQTPCEGSRALVSVGRGGENGEGEERRRRRLPQGPAPSAPGKETSGSERPAAMVALPSPSHLSCTRQWAGLRPCATPLCWMAIGKACRRMDHRRCTGVRRPSNVVPTMLGSGSKS